MNSKHIPRIVIIGAGFGGLNAALRLARYFGTSAEFWMGMQTAYDLWHATRAMKAEIRRIPTAKAQAAEHNRRRD